MFVNFFLEKLKVLEPHPCVLSRRGHREFEPAPFCLCKQHETGGLFRRTNEIFFTLEMLKIADGRKQVSVKFSLKHNFTPSLMVGVHGKRAQQPIPQLVRANGGEGCKLPSPADSALVCPLLVTPNRSLFSLFCRYDIE